MPDVSPPGLHVPVTRDTAPDLVRLVALHAAVVGVPVLVLVAVVVVLAAGPVVGVAVAVVVAVVVAGVVTGLRVRGVDDATTEAIGARPAPAEEFPRLHGLVDSVAMAVGVAPPAVFVVDTPARNAVTWGDGRTPLRVAFTTGLLDSVDRIQLEALVGRQLAVARDGSVDVLSVASVLFGSTGVLDGWVAAIANRAIDDRAVVRADLEGARATGYPPGLVSALGVVAAGSSELASVPRALTGACLAAPRGADGPFAVHPPLADRIDLLREI